MNLTSILEEICQISLKNNNFQAKIIDPSQYQVQIENIVLLSRNKLNFVEEGAMEFVLNWKRCNHDAFKAFKKMVIAQKMIVVDTMKL